MNNSSTKAMRNRDFRLIREYIQKAQSKGWRVRLVVMGSSYKVQIIDQFYTIEGARAKFAQMLG